MDAVPFFGLNDDVEFVAHFFTIEGRFEALNDAASTLQELEGIPAVRAVQGFSCIILKGVVNADDGLVLDLHGVPRWGVGLVCFC